MGTWVGDPQPVTPEEAIREAKSNRVRPVVLVVGDERVLADRVLGALRVAALCGGSADFNEEHLTAGEADVDRVINAVRMAPMLSPRRFVVVRAVERWETTGPEKKGARNAQAPMDRLIQYVSAPLDTACLVLVATKLDGRRKLASMARTGGFLVSCDPIKRASLPRFIEQEAKLRGHAIPFEVADVLAEIAGPELGAVLDAIERLSLYVGDQQPITENDVAMCVTRIRPSSVWSLVGAVAARDAATALRVLGDVYEPQDRGLRLVGVLAWSTRQLLRFAVAFQGGASPEQAAKAAGAPPFKARELASQVRKLKIEEIEHWLRILADTDLALKSSRRPSRAVLESAILTMTMGLPR